jgi:hypothetical protein
MLWMIPICIVNPAMAQQPPSIPGLTTDGWYQLFTDSMRWLVSILNQTRSASPRWQTSRLWSIKLLRKCLERLNSYTLHSSEPSSVASISVRSQESGWELHDQSDRFHLNLVRVTVKLHSKHVERRFNLTELHQCSRTIPRWTGPCIGVMYWLMDGSEFWTRTYCIESWWVILIQYLPV